MKKFFITPMLSLVIILGLWIMPNSVITAHAADNYDLWIGGVQINSDNASDITAAINKLHPETATGSASYDKKTNTINLKNFVFTDKTLGKIAEDYYGILYKGTEELNISASGENAIASRFGSDTDSYGIYTENGSINFLGTGKISVKGENSYSNGYSYGVLGNVFVDGPSVTICSGDSNQRSSTGLIGDIHLSKGDLTVSAGNGKEYFSTGVEGNILVDNGSLDISCGTAYYDSYAVKAADFTINGGTVTVNSGQTISVNCDSVGIEGDTVVNGGSLSVSTKRGRLVYGIQGHLTLNDGQVNINNSSSSEGNYGISGSVVVNGGELTVNSGSCGSDTMGISSDLTVYDGIVNVSSGAAQRRSVGVWGNCYIHGGTVNISSKNGRYSYGIDGNCTVNGGDSVISSGEAAEDSYGITKNLTIQNGNAKIFSEKAPQSYATGYPIIDGGTLELVSWGEGNVSQIGEGVPDIRSGAELLAVSVNSDGSTPVDYVSENFDQYKYLKTGPAYKIYIGNEHITERNKDDVFGDGKVSFDPETNTLKLNNVSISSESKSSMISYNDINTVPFTIDVSGKNILSQNGKDYYISGIVCDNDLIIKFSKGSSLELPQPKNTSDWGSTCGVYAKDLTFTGEGEFTVYGNKLTGELFESTCGMKISGDLTLSDGVTVNVIGGDTDSAIEHEWSEVETSYSYGIYKTAQNGDTIDIGDGCTLNVKSGKSVAGNYNRGRNAGIVIIDSQNLKLTGSAKAIISGNTVDDKYVSYVNDLSNGICFWNDNWYGVKTFNVITDSWTGSVTIQSEGRALAKYSSGYGNGELAFIHNSKEIDVVGHSSYGYDSYISEDECSVTSISGNTATILPHKTFEVEITAGEGMNYRNTSEKVFKTQVINTVSLPVKELEAEEGYYFPEDYAVPSVNGIEIERIDETRIRVSGKPTDDTKIVLLDATPKQSLETYTLTWNFDGGVASGDYTYGNLRFGAPITAPTVSKEGYTFTGWDIEILSSMPANDLTITAKWNKKENTNEELVKAFVRRFYTIILKREKINEEEIEYYTSRLLSHEIDGCTVARGFVMSPEYTEKQEPNDIFVDKMYAAFFNREADDAQFYINLLESGQTREVVLAGFVNSPEFKNLCADYGIDPGELVVEPENNNQENNQGNNEENNQGNNGENNQGNNPTDEVTKLNLDTTNVDPDKLDAYVKNLYLKILGRQYDEGGLEYWKEQIMAGTTYDASTAARVGFFESPEYQGMNKTSEQFVTDCYHAFLDREPEPDGLSYWMNKLDSGEYSKQKVIDLGFGHSEEFKGILRDCGFEIIE